MPTSMGSEKLVWILRTQTTPVAAIMLNSGGKRSISVLLTHLDPLQRTDTIATLVVTKGMRTYFEKRSAVTYVHLHSGFSDGPALSGALLSSSCDSAPLISSARTFSPVSCRHVINVSQRNRHPAFP